MQTPFKCKDHARVSQNVKLYKILISLRTIILINNEEANSRLTRKVKTKILQIAQETIEKLFFKKIITFGAFSLNFPRYQELER